MAPIADLDPDRILLTDRVAVVTGAARGIGAATAVALARFGADVAVCDKDPGPLPGVEAEIAAAGRRCFSEVLDVRDGERVEAFLGRARDRLGPIDVLVNNAGGGFRALFEAVSPKGEGALVAENFTTVSNCVRHGAPLMADGGAIVNVTSVEAYHASPGYAVYGAMKAAVQQFTQTLALELGGRGIRVNCVAPDMIVTPGEDALTEGSGTMIEGLAPSPLRRRAAPEECAAVIVFLASDMAGFVTGSTIPVDGGTVAAAAWKIAGDGRFVM